MGRIRLSALIVPFGAAMSGVIARDTQIPGDGSEQLTASRVRSTNRICGRCDCQWVTAVDLDSGTDVRGLDTERGGTMAETVIV